MLFTPAYTHLHPLRKLGKRHDVFQKLAEPIVLTIGDFFQLAVLFI